jgi:ribose transport system substrate-binding protein
VAAGALLLVSACGSSSPSSASAAAAASTSGCPSTVAADRAAVQASLHPSTKWDGPTTGPKAVKGKFIAFVAGSLQNGGNLGVLAGFREAAKLLDWRVQTFDGQNTVSGDSAALSQAIAVKPDAIVIVGFPYILTVSEVKAAVAHHIVVVGWHAQNDPGPSPDHLLFTNVTSPNTAIGKLAGEYAIVATNGRARVGILTDLSIPQTLAKADGIKAAIDACQTSSVLTTDSFPFANITTDSPGLVTAMLQRFGSKLTDIFAINDLAFDASVPALRTAGVSATGAPHLISAGDGSASAFQRISAGQFQTATVAEPLYMHGWQVADELNRAFAGKAPSGYVTQPHLVINADVSEFGGAQSVYNPPNGYQAAYRKIWGV